MYSISIRFFLLTITVKASFILLPMDETSQKTISSIHGITYWCLNKITKPVGCWTIAGSFLLPDADEIRKECQIRGVSFEVISDGDEAIKWNIESFSKYGICDTWKAPKIAVYTPKGKQPWDDAVTLVLTYAEIPFTPIYDEEVLVINCCFMIGCTCIMKIFRAIR
jgi:hypothetical protein